MPFSDHCLHGVISVVFRTEGDTDHTMGYVAHHIHTNRNISTALSMVRVAYMYWRKQCSSEMESLQKLVQDSTNTLATCTNVTVPESLLIETKLVLIYFSIQIHAWTRWSLYARRTLGDLASVSRSSLNCYYPILVCFQHRNNPNYQTPDVLFYM